MKPLTAFIIATPLFCGFISVANHDLKLLKPVKKPIQEVRLYRDASPLIKQVALPKNQQAMDKVYGWADYYKPRATATPDMTVYKKSVYKDNHLTKEQRSQAFNNLFKRQ